MMMQKELWCKLYYCTLSSATQFTDKMTITSGPGISLLIYFPCTVAGELLTPPHIKPSKRFFAISLLF